MQLPIFPLGLVIFPGETLNLHIFEPRYKQLINDCVAQGNTFGIPPFLDGKVASTGTEAELLSIHRIYNNGEMDVSVKGNRIFQVSKIHSNYEGKLYAGATIKWLDYDMKADMLLSEQIVELMHELHNILQVAKNKIPLAEELKTFDIAHFIGLSMEQEYELLGKKKEIERQKYIFTHLIKIIPVVRETEALKTRIHANGHFKNLLPPDF
jgi:ATP-dependent Lon protease